MHRLPVALTSVLALALSVVVVSTPEAVAAGQTANFYMLPQLAQPGSSPASAGRARSAMWAKLRPARPGRKVVLQRKSGARWINVSASREDRQGVAEFTAPYQVKGKVARYRVSAVRYKGLRKVNSASAATNTWGAPDFDDSFSGSYAGGDLPRWATRYQTYGATTQRTCAATDDTATRVANGTAQLSVIESAGPDPSAEPRCRPDGDSSTYAWRHNGMIGTQGDYSFRYGYAAARIKFQDKPGQHAGFWLQQAAPGGAEIDAIEWYGRRPNADKQMSSQVHVGDASYPDSQGAYLTRASRFGSDWSSKYHVFSVEWTPRAYVFRIDGKQTRTITRYVSDQPEYLVLSLLSSDWELGAAPEAPRQTMNVDWVRVWDMDRTQ